MVALQKSIKLNKLILILLKWKKQRHNLTETVRLKFEYNTGVILYRLIELITNKLEDIQFPLNQRLYAYKLQLSQRMQNITFCPILNKHIYSKYYHCFINIFTITISNDYICLM